VAPVGVGGDRWRDVSDDMIGELVLAEVVEEESLLPIIVWRKIHEDDRNEGLMLSTKTTCT
jgi:hypothetical protein